MPQDDYPALPHIPSTLGVVGAEAFSSAVSQVTLAASKDETNPRLTGVKIEIDGEKISFIATDRYRLAIAELDWIPSSPQVSGSALIRARVLADISKSIVGLGDVTISLTDNDPSELIGFEIPGRQTTSALIDGTEYPDVRNLLAQDHQIEAIVPVHKFLEAARRVAIVVERNTALHVTFRDGETVLDAGTGEEAQAQESIESTLRGEEITVAFNPHFLIDGLSAIHTEFVHISLSQPTKPALFVPQESIDGEYSTNFQYLLVPIRFPR
jgi:DNA polymerase-3 subunit beta